MDLLLSQFPYIQNNVFLLLCCCEFLHFILVKLCNGAFHSSIISVLVGLLLRGVGHIQPV